MLPWNLWDAVFGKLAMDFSTWIVAGLMIIVGAVLILVFNADVLLGLVMRVFGRIRGARSRAAHVDGVSRWPRASAPARRSRCSRSSSSRS